MILVAACTASYAYLTGPLIDEVFVKGNSEMMTLVPLLICTVALIGGLANYGSVYTMRCLGQRVITDMQQRLYRHILNLDFARITGESTGKIVSRFTNDINTLRASISIVITGIAKESLTLVFLVGMMFYRNPTLAIIAFTAFPVAIYPVIRLGRRMRKISHKTQEELGIFTSKLDETFKSIKIIKAYQKEDWEITRARAVMERIYILFTKAIRTQAASSPIVETISGFSVAAVIWYSGSQHLSGGEFLSFMAAALLAYKPAKALSGINTNLEEGLAAAQRLFALLDTQPEIADKPDAKPLEFKGGQILFENVHFQYTHQKTALCGITMSVLSGKTVALVGPSGGGKSTIMNLILRLYDIDSGNIFIDGQNIKDITINSLRQHIGFVSQEINLFDDTVAANIAYGKNEASAEEIVTAARLAAAHEFIEKLPEGYNTIIGEGGLTLSGGQRQRLSIARAMLRNAPILLLDEATSALDQISEKKVQEALGILMKGRTTIVIAHRLATVINSDVIYVIKNGKIVESGKHGDLLAGNGEYGKLYKGLE
jgi:subfamily B ATP-binding cassette protein MsbA